ncbi:MAG: Lrp/AsnC family transcriptional regulator [Chloroflexi bacterium]|nr:Lrp/AsnC family transcriptional regulator [Chloroflexota bacterium]MYF79068.1 Lrp/AsnC family transcriptional regulator [Chloroflexota bacterium]MYK61629.1 Lrp/AsnC family transcriptional regulator [Chloroflexota bacterium]
MDSIDRQIIAALNEDGRAANAKIAKKVKVSEGTVRRRLKKLTGDKTINIVTVQDPQKMGYQSEVLIGMQVEPDMLEEVASRMAEFKYTTLVSITTGTYDVFAWATLPNAESLGEFIRDHVGKTPGVQRTETFVSLGVRKRSYSLPLEV